jgi:hypothetical protein
MDKEFSCVREKGDCMASRSSGQHLHAELKKTAGEHKGLVNRLRFQLLPNKNSYC